MGLPQLLSAKHHFHRLLLREWLSECDRDHNACQPASYEISTDALQCPTRVIDIGTETSKCVRLVCSEDLMPVKDDFKYVALSYAWGDKTKHKRCLSTTTNQQDLRNGIAESELPLTFQDAITVTRNIGVRYLWIDALCIIQEGPDSDFAIEAERMEVVFSNAYCVIAASRATGTSDGFLGDREPQKVVVLPQRCGNDVCISETIDDFQRDVIEGSLNMRGWVLQERALARRTIFFTAKQTYWQCGAGVRTETLTRMTNTQAAFLGDPNFPKVAEGGSRGAQIGLYEFLYNSYSTLHFSDITDRPYAIAGLETRLAKAFDCEAGFGVFEKYLRRGILWRRASAELTKIDFSKSSATTGRIPSWSWMAYEGAIKFLDLPYRGVDWEEQDLHSPWASSQSKLASTGVRHSVRTGSNTHISVMIREFSYSVSAQEQLIFDQDGGNGRKQLSRCVVIGRQKGENRSSRMDQRHYVLLVRPKARSQMYERVGVGYLTGRSIRFDRPALAASVC